MSEQIQLEDNIIVLGAEKVNGCGLVVWECISRWRCRRRGVGLEILHFKLSLSLSLRLCSLGVSFLLSLYLLKSIIGEYFSALVACTVDTDAPEELFAIHLVKFAHDIFDRVVETGNDDMLDGIHPAIRRTDDLVKDHKCRLERRELDERLDRLGVHLLRSQHLLATSPKAGQIKV